MSLVSCASRVVPFAGAARSRRALVSVRASSQPETPARPPAARPKLPPRPPVMLGPDGQPLEVVPVEKAGPEAWAGVAQLDTGKDDVPFDWGRVALMVGGDALALLIFAAAGRANHGEGSLPVETLQTALPFLIGWFSTAPFLGAYSREAQWAKLPAGAAIAAKCWIVATPLALVIRGISKGYVPPTPFIAVSFGVTCLLLVGWRSGLAAATKEAPKLTPAQVAAARKNKKGNPFEFLELLKGLTTRW